MINSTLTGKNNASKWRICSEGLDKLKQNEIVWSSERLETRPKRDLPQATEHAIEHMDERIMNMSALEVVSSETINELLLARF